MTSRSNRSKQVGNTKQPAKQIAPAKHWCFTYNNYTEEIIEMIRSDRSIKSYIFQEEKGESGTPHLQGYVEFKEKCRPVAKIQNTKFHWEKCRNIEASKAYCSKSDTRIGKVYTNIAIKREDPRLEKFEMRNWQKMLHDMLIEDPDDRTIIWIVDKLGNKGKSLFSKWMNWKYEDVCSMTMNKSADMLTLVEEHYKTYLIDLPRSYDTQYTPYNAIEQIKNGFVTEGKLKKQARRLIFAPPHVVIFSNSEPDQSKMSGDRWKIIFI